MNTIILACHQVITTRNLLCPVKITLQSSMVEPYKNLSQQEIYHISTDTFSDGIKNVGIGSRPQFS